MDFRKGEIIAIDKPYRMSSFGALAHVRYLLSKKLGFKVKIGHAGTLDPFATGLLIILKGDACKRAGEFLKLDKVYEATIHLGQTSTTGDPEGELTAISSYEPTRDEVDTILTRFVGTVTQTPPIYSAIKINGRRAYQLAREGKEVAVPEREVIIYSLELIEYTYPEIRVRAHVGSGTYIRSLAEDIGTALGTGAYCAELRRTVVGKWQLGEAKTVTEVA